MCLLISSSYSIGNTQHILYLTSFPSGIEWGDTLMDGLTHRIKENEENDNMVLDSYRIDELQENTRPEVKTSIVNIIHEKISNRHIDLIVTGDTRAYSFVIDNRQLLNAENIPIIFTGFLSDDPNIIYKRYPKTLGIVRRLSIKEQVDLIQYLNRNDYNTPIAVIYDYSKEVDNIQNIITKEGGYGKNKLVFIPFLSRDDLKYSLDDIGKTNLIVFISAVKPKFGPPFKSSKEAVKFISTISNNSQIYVMRNTDVSDEVLGGVVSDANTLIDLIYDFSKKILIEHKDIETIHNVDPVPKYTIINYEQIKKQNIDSSFIPTGSVIINDPFSSIKKNIGLLVSILTVISLQSGLIILMVVFYLKYKRTTIELRGSLSDYNILFNKINLPFLSLNMKEFIKTASDVSSDNIYRNFSDTSKIIDKISVAMVNSAARGIFRCEDGLLSPLSAFFTKESKVKIVMAFISSWLDVAVKEITVEVDIIRHDRSVINAIISCPSLHAMNENMILPVIVQDITEKRRIERNYINLSLYDSLTGLPNKANLNNAFNTFISDIKENEKLILFLLDIDRFKYVNDALGHIAGDELLKIIAKRLEINLNPSDFISRLGGDEYCILSKYTVNDQFSLESVINSISKKIQRFMEGVFTVYGQAVYITAGIGIAVIPDHSTTFLDALSKADTALYSAKELGKGKYKIYTPEMGIAQKKIVQLDTELQIALNNDEFMLMYQPLVSCCGVVYGAEVLVRWRRADGTIVPPNIFIKQAEDTQFIIPLGKRIIEKACNDWVKTNLNIPIAINVSAIQLHEEGFVDFVRQTIINTGIPSRFLELEFTESILLSRNLDVFRRLTELIEMGIKFSLDDFGTGYSSVVSIAELPISKIKIDKSFVDLLPSKRGISLIHAIIQISDTFELKIVAEGVEKEEQVKILCSLGCDYIQGYFFGKPMTIDDFVKFKTNRSIGVSYERKIDKILIDPVGQRGIDNILFGPQSE